MSKPVTAPEHLANLRLRAASRLTGAAGAKGAPGGATDALAVLHELASSPATAADALALLHELQVHQVELELQDEELRQSRAELESALREQIDLYDFLPAGCFSIDDRLSMHEINLQGARMLGVARDDAYLAPLDSFLSPEGARTLRAQIAALAQGQACAPATLQLSPRDGVERTVQAQLGADATGQRVLVVWVEVDPGQPAGAGGR